LQGKKFRNQKRSQIQRFANNIFYYGKTDKLDELQKEINAFKDFYKSFYRINDYSISSLSNSNDEKKNANIEFMLSIIKSTL
jgi:alcohol dehydrogenase YqhD (iron-dependent ADH family)